jgi:hypothetical protein
MPATRSLMRAPRAFWPAALSILVAAAPAAAQTPQPVATPAPAELQFLPRYDFHLTIDKLVGASDPDERFSWDSHYGGSFDFVDYVTGRLTILADYEAVMGHEFRPFDPNQANYLLEASLSYRAGKTEVVGAYRHVSRHLSDRPKEGAIAWNTPVARLLRRFAVGGTTVDGAFEIGRVIQSSYVDYRWIVDVSVQARRPVAARATVFARGSATTFTVNGTVDRGTQQGAMVEAGLGLSGGAGVLELFAGFERRVDAYPLDRVAKNWGFVGFRLLSR